MSGRTTGAVLMILGALGSQGCGGVGLALFGVGAGVSGGTGVSYTLDSIAYKTFVASDADLRAATAQTLKRMAIDVTETQKTETGTDITATAGEIIVQTADTLDSKSVLAKNAR